MKYFFNIRHHDAIIWDSEGIELDSIESARLEALQGARDIIAEQIKTGTPLHMNTMFEVRDEGSRVVLLISFASVLLASLLPLES